MNRRLSIVLGLVAAASLGVSLSSCNEPSCGPGTVQQQQKDGTLKCVPVDVQAQTTPCDTDGGNVVIVGGKCVSAVQCDPGTTMNVNGICVGTGGSNKPTCHTPAAGKSCIYGTIYNFKDNKQNAVPVTLDLYDATKLLQGLGPIMTVDSSADGSGFAFQDFAPPPIGVVVIISHDAAMMMTPTGTGGQGVSGNNQYHIDAYAIPKTDSNAWGFDISAGGAQIARYFSDPKPSSTTQLLNNETHPVAGVVMLKDGSNANAKYFDPTLTMVDGTLTATSSSGVAIVASPIPTGGNFPQFSGMGGGISPWESLPGGSAPGIVIITRFHPGP